MDRIDAARRSENMRRIRGADTRPEMAVRRALFARGLRFRLHRRDLPGRPDIVMPGRRLVIFVHGCFWHRHPGCPGCTSPRTRSDFWQTKFAATVARDARVQAALRESGWRVETVWECEASHPGHLAARLDEVLTPAPGPFQTR
jgi:DNA mismatch endonuclease (patch repair protein)